MVETFINDVYTTILIQDALEHMKPGTFCVMDCYTNQFAEGITGVTRLFNYYFPEGGFKKRPAQQFKNNCLDKQKNIKGKGDWGVGTIYYGKKVVSYEQLEKAMSKTYWNMAAYYGWD